MTTFYYIRHQNPLRQFFNIYIWLSHWVLNDKSKIFTIQQNAEKENKQQQQQQKENAGKNALPVFEERFAWVYVSGYVQTDHQLPTLLDVKC